MGIGYKRKKFALVIAMDDLWLIARLSFIFTNIDYKRLLSYRVAMRGFYETGRGGQMNKRQAWFLYTNWSTFTVP